MPWWRVVEQIQPRRICNPSTTRNKSERHEKRITCSSIDSIRIPSAVAIIRTWGMNERPASASGDVVLPEGWSPDTAGTGQGSDVLQHHDQSPFALTKNHHLYHHHHHHLQHLHPHMKGESGSIMRAELDSAPSIKSFSRNKMREGVRCCMSAAGSQWGLSSRVCLCAEKRREKLTHTAGVDYLCQVLARGRERETRAIDPRSALWCGQGTGLHAPPLKNPKEYKVYM